MEIKFPFQSYPYFIFIFFKPNILVLFRRRLKKIISLLMTCEEFKFEPTQGERGQWAVYYTSSQCFTTTFLFGGLTTLGTIVNFDWVVY